MKATTRQNLQDAEDWCDENDKSTVFMIQYMMDCAKVSHDCVMRFLEKKADAYARQQKTKPELESGEPEKKLAKRAK